MLSAYTNASCTSARFDWSACMLVTMLALQAESKIEWKQQCWLPCSATACSLHSYCSPPLPSCSASSAPAPHLSSAAVAGTCLLRACPTAVLITLSACRPRRACDLPRDLPQASSASAGNQPCATAGHIGSCSPYQGGPATCAPWCSCIECPSAYPAHVLVPGHRTQRRGTA